MTDAPWDQLCSPTSISRFTSEQTANILSLIQGVTFFHKEERALKRTLVMQGMRKKEEKKYEVLRVEYRNLSTLRPTPLSNKTLQLGEGGITKEKKVL